MQHNIGKDNWGQRNHPDENNMNAAYMANMQQMMVGQQVNPANLTPVQLQQWQQWQMQYQAWQAQYGKEYEKSMQAMSQMGSMPPQPMQGAPPLPPENVRPPLPVAPVEAPKPPLPSSEPPEELSESEKNFDIEFKQWEKQFQDWKIQNANHPDKTQYSEYEKKWESWREHLLERREQMKLKRLAAAKPVQVKVEPAKVAYTPFNNEPLQFKKQSHEIMSDMVNEKADNSNFNWSNVLAKPDSEQKGLVFDKSENLDNQRPNTQESKIKPEVINRFPEEDNKQSEPVFCTPDKNQKQPKSSKDKPNMNPHNFNSNMNSNPNIGGFGPNNFGPGFGPNNCGPGFGPNNFAGGFGPMNFGPGFGNGFFPNNFGPGFVPNNFVMGNFGPGFNNMPGNFNNFGPNNFNCVDGPRNFNDGSRGFNDGHRNSDDRPKNFNENSRDFNDGPRNFNDGSRDFNGGNRNFNEGPGSFNDGPRDLFNNGPRNFNDGPRNFFNNGPRNFNEGSLDFNDGPRNFNEGPRDFNNGPRNFNEGPRDFNDGPRNFNDNQRDFNDGPRNFKDIDKNNLDGDNGSKRLDFQGLKDNLDHRGIEGNFDTSNNRNLANNDSPKFPFGDGRNEDFDNRRMGNNQFPMQNSNNFDDRSNEDHFDINRFDDRFNDNGPYDEPNMRSKPPSLMDLKFDSNRSQNFSNAQNNRFEHGDVKSDQSGLLMKKEWEKYEKDDYYDDPFEERDEPTNNDKDFRFPHEPASKPSLLGPRPGAFFPRQNEPFRRDSFNEESFRRNESHQKNNFFSNNPHQDSVSQIPAERRPNEPFLSGKKPGILGSGPLDAQNINKPPLLQQGSELGRKEDEKTAQDPSQLSGFVGNILAKLGVAGVENAGPLPGSNEILHSNEPPFQGDEPSSNPENEWKPKVFDYSTSKSTTDNFQFEIVKDYSHGDVRPQSFDYGHGGGSSFKKFDYGHGSDKANKNLSYENKANVFDYSHGSSHSPSSDRFPNKSRSREHSDTSRSHELRNRSPTDNRGTGENFKNVNYDIDSRDRVGYRGRDTDRNRDRRDRDFDRNRDFDRRRDRDRDFDRQKDRDFDRNRDRDFDRNRETDISRSRDRDGERTRDRDNDRTRDRERSPIRKRSRSPLQRSRSPRRNIRRDDEVKSADAKAEDVKEKESKTENLAVPVNKADSSLHVISVEDLIHIPGRSSRPQKIVFIMRGISGSGKSFVTRLIKEKETEFGNSAPRILSIDDYFMVDGEEEVKDPESGQIVKKKALKYEYDADMENPYQLALLKAFKKTVSDGYFPFIIVDSANKQTKDLDEMWSFAKQKGFQVYVCEMDNDIPACVKRNVHKRCESEIETQAKGWEAAPKHYLRLDVRSLLQSEAIDEVEMEDAVEEEEKEESETSAKPDKDNEKDEDEPEISYFLKSKWDDFESSVQKLDRLDGLKKKKSSETTMEAYLYTDDLLPEPDTSVTTGKKRVRWADMEERRQQEKMRAIGFVVGQTDWKRMMDPSSGESALTRTKYI